MQILKAFKFRLIPTNGHRSKFLQFAGCNRFIWNKALAIQKERLEKKERILSYHKLSAMLKVWKREEGFEFLAECQSQTYQQTLMHLADGFKKAFTKGSQWRIPVFKKKGVYDSFGYPQGFKLDEVTSRVFLPKIGWVRYTKSRNIVGTPKNVTVSRRGEHWYVSVQTEQEVEDPVHKSESIVGIDRGVKRFLTLSNGDVFEPLNKFKKSEGRLRRLQKSLSRKKKGSSNWKKAKTKVNKFHIRIADARNDYLHKVSTTISKNHAMIVLEDLKVKNMSKSAKGDMKKKGKNVRAKAALNKAILDQGWGEFKRQLQYKQSWAGGEVILVDPKNTSRQCSVCEYTEKENRKSQESFLCLGCGHFENADLNAAKNILRAGHAQLACGELVQLDLSLKQEPTKKAA